MLLLTMTPAELFNFQCRDKFPVQLLFSFYEGAAAALLHLLVNKRHANLGRENKQLDLMPAYYCSNAHWSSVIVNGAYTNLSGVSHPIPGRSLAKGMAGM